VDRTQLQEWLEGYERAWRTPGTDALEGLFTEGAVYSAAPFEQPHMGLADIARMWEAERERPDEEFTLESEVVAADGDTGVAKVHVRYGAPTNQEYRDIWIVRLDDSGLCSYFEEWPFWPPDTEGGIASGAGG
jgi:ketosteroid isomerase-like protein